MQTEAQLDLIDINSDQITRPEQPVPEMIKKIITNIIRQIMMEGIKLQAVDKQSELIRLPSNSLIAKLHALAEKSGGNREAFVEDIEKLHELATGQMRRCVSRDHNLREYLLEHDPVESFFQQPMDKGLIELCQEIDYKPKADSELKQDLIAAFYATFFSMMRKRKIAEEKHDAG